MIVLLAIWKPQLCKYFYQYQIVYVLARELMPIDYGSQHQQSILLENFATLLLFTHYIWLDIISASVALSIVMVGSRTLLYNDSQGVAKLATTCVSILLYNFYNSIVIYMIFSWTGFLYMNSELPRTGYEQLLNNIKDGILIVDEQKYNVQFMNRTATKLTKRLN